MAKVFLSIPVLDRPELKMLYSVYQAMLTDQGHQVRIYFNENDSLISRVRNVHLSVFLNEFTDCEYFVSIDSDLEILNSLAVDYTRTSQYDLAIETFEHIARKISLDFFNKHVYAWWIFSSFCKYVVFVFYWFISWKNSWKEKIFVFLLNSRLICWIVFYFN